VVNTNPKANNASMAPSIRASVLDIAPVVTGRCAVRFTCLSKSLSATSFKQQPALRINIVPNIKTNNKCQPGKPWAAIHKAVNVGHNNNSQPAGRFQRIKSKYKDNLLRIKYDQDNRVTPGNSQA
jgi:hypothetical protein